MKIDVEGKRRRRPKKRSLDTIQNDIRAVDVYVGDLENRDEWRLRIRVVDPKYLGDR
jgi:hypothetical protein